MTSNNVRAWTFTNGYPSTLKLSSLPVPSENEIQSQKKILVKVQTCALNPVDIQKMNMPTYSYPWGDKSEKPCVMDFCGTVLAAGPGTGFNRGDEIMGLTLSGGVLQEVTALDAAMTVAVKKPASWSYEKAAAITLVWLTAKASIDAVAPWVEKTSSKRVAILGGSSSTGMYTIMLAKRKGWKVVATSSGRNKEFVVNDLKADAHVDHTKEDVRKGVSAFKPDAVIDCVGGTECIGLPSSKRYISIVGDKTGRTMMGGPYTYYDWTHPFVAAGQWLRWAKGEIGLGESYDVTILKPKKDWLEEAAKTLRPEEIYVDSVYKFEDAKDAFERLNTGRAKGKVVIQVAGAAGERSRL
ncbi:Protein YIM1-2 [Pseudocercospora fuligena]|uniref:Protein YIM1-2 n=1 Tax=Pseudocercospora fuligena TaxID=685502 RepID=A0A8H6RB16_9PEZI|nr:Protein YIM1-2 [Pseudocercospora fuligena]